jgi:hypothetical protein
MRKLAWIFCSGVLLSVIASSIPFAAGTKSVVVTNNTSSALDELYASSSVAGDWDAKNPNLLAGDSIAPGQQKVVVIADGAAECNYDLMGVLAGTSQHAYQYNVNVCNSGSWIISQ